MMSRAAQWLRGELPLSRAFWLHAIGYGSLINATTTALSFAVLAAGGPGWLAFAAFLAPIPYNLTAVLAVWRSAERYRGDAGWATAARIAVVAWALLASLL